MMRVIVTPAVLPPTALAELKDWLGIATAADDATLARLLAMAVDVCGDFTGLIPIACTAEEIVAPAGAGYVAPGAVAWPNPSSGSQSPCGAGLGWSRLSSRPVRMVLSVSRVTPDGSRAALDTGDYTTSVNAEGEGAVQLPAGDDGVDGYARFAVQFTAGLAADWDSLPPALRHGIMRLAAHQYRGREGAGAEPLPPATVTALWRPWRRLRLA